MNVGMPVYNDQREGVDAVDRAITMLRCFVEPGEALPLSALAHRSGLYKSTILRIAGSLLNAGLLTREADGLYRLGPEVRRLVARHPSVGAPRPPLPPRRPPPA